MERTRIFGRALCGLGAACALIIGLANGEARGLETSAKQAILIDDETGRPFICTAYSV